MAEREGTGSKSAAPRGEKPRWDPTAPPALDVAAALGNLEAAKRDFNLKLGVAAPRAEPAEPENRPPEPPPAPAPTPSARANEALDARMEEAEREAREYLEQAKRRADSLVTAMVGAVERQASEIRHEAEESIRSRWQQVEEEAGRYIDESRRVGEQMVAERRERIAKLSNGIADRAEALTAGMEDADRVRRQFDAFIRALSVTADQIAEDSSKVVPRRPGAVTADAELRDLSQLFRPSSVAA